jgi:NADH:ubiquinone oxidoreductase subunit 5 (subunit L)/multisubunit Na+/H+ antiporter MnhA subunit
MKEVINEESMGIPKKKNVILLLLLGIITLGISQYIWFVKRVKELNNLQTKTKTKKTVPIISLIFIITIAITAITLGVFMYMQWEDFDAALKIEDIPQEILITSTIIISLSTILGILTLMMSFKYRKILNEALVNKGTKTKLSGLYTFLFHFLYLQYEINRIIKDNETQKRTGLLIALVLVIITIIASIISFISL